MTLHASPTIAAQERQVRKLADAGDPMAKAQVEAWERARTIEPTSGAVAVSGLLPKAAAIAVGAFKRALPKLWATETDRFDARRSFDLDAWRAAFRRSRDNRVPAAVYGKAIIEVLYDHARTGVGIAIVTMERIATIVDCCVDTVRKVIRQGEIDGFLDSWNRTERPTRGPLKGFVIRAANAYVPLMPEQDYDQARAAARDSAEAVLPSDAVSPAQAWLGRVARQIKRGEQLFRGLVGRKLGLNLTPLARAAPA